MTTSVGRTVAKACCRRNRLCWAYGGGRAHRHTTGFAEQRAWAHRLGALCVVWLGWGCDAPIVEPQTIAGLRVVAVRLGAEQDPDRAQLVVEEAGVVQVWVVAERQIQFRVELKACAAKPSGLATPACAEAARPFAELRSVGHVGEPLVFPLRLPPQLGAGQPWLVKLRVCELPPAEPSADDQPSCDSSGGVSAVYRSYVAESEASANRNPRLGDDLLSIGGRSWVQPAAPLSSECSPLLPRVVPGQATEIRFELEGDDRELLPESESFARSPRESLVFSHLLTEPGLERAWSSIEHDASNLQFALNLTIDVAAASSGGAGSGSAVPYPAAFYLVARDERGGVDVLARGLCVQSR